MNVLCLDLEGVLVPEIWQAVARETGVEALMLTTRDIADYDELMKHRIDTMRAEGIAYSGIREVIGTLDPLPGAVEFLDWARRTFQVAILSDTFYQFGMPLMEKLGQPLLLCHRLLVEDDRIVGYRMRQADPKTKAVMAFQSLDLPVLAAGDSFNDVGMLTRADAGVFFRAPAAIVSQHGFDAVETYDELGTRLVALSETLGSDRAA